MVYSRLHDVERECMPSAGSSNMTKMELPTTLAMILIFESECGENHVFSLWAGDSRCYMLCEDGFYQISIDDSGDSYVNAMDDLMGAGSQEMNNRIGFSMENNALNCKYLSIKSNTIFMCATDGIYGYLPSPMYLEYILRFLCNGCKTADKFKSSMEEFYQLKYPYDDASTAMIFIGSESIPFNKYVSIFGEKSKLSNFNKKYVESFPSLPEQESAGNTEIHERSIYRKLEQDDGFNFALCKYFEDCIEGHLVVDENDFGYVDYVEMKTSAAEYNKVRISNESEKRRKDALEQAETIKNALIKHINDHVKIVDSHALSNIRSAKHKNETSSNEVQVVKLREVINLARKLYDYVRFWSFDKKIVRYYGYEEWRDRYGYPRKREPWLDSFFDEYYKTLGDDFCIETAEDYVRELIDDSNRRMCIYDTCKVSSVEPIREITQSEANELLDSFVSKKTLSIAHAISMSASEFDMLYQLKTVYIKTLNESESLNVAMESDDSIIVTSSYIIDDGLKSKIGEIVKMKKSHLIKEYISRRMSDKICFPVGKELEASIGETLSKINDINAVQAEIENAYSNYKTEVFNLWEKYRPIYEKYISTDGGE